MLGLRFIKAQPTTYLIKYKSGNVVKEGAGISFWYFAPTNSLVSIPLASTDVPFIIKETTSDFQAVTIQGQVIYKITEPQLIAKMLNFTLDATGKSYESEDPSKLQTRIINHVQVLTRTELHKIPLREALKMSENLVDAILPKLRSLESITSLGLEILDFSITAIKPTPETSRALEAEMREQFLKEADTAIYSRRNAAVEQERAIKENELNTELAVEQKRKQIREAQMDAELAVLEKKQQMKMAEVNSNIEVEQEKKKFESLAAENSKIRADAKSYDISVCLRPLLEADPKVLQVLALSNMDASQLIAQAFRDLSENTEKIGQLNVSPDLLKTLLDK